MTILDNSETPVMIEMSNGKTIMGKVLEMKVTGEDSPFGRSCMVLEDVATFQTGRHPNKPQEIIYNLLQWQTQDTYIPWDKVLAFGVASTLAQDYYRQVYQRVQLAGIEEVAAMNRTQSDGRPGTKVVIETP
jgi:hypothetical protein